MSQLSHVRRVALTVPDLTAEVVDAYAGLVAASALVVSEPRGADVTAMAEEHLVLLFRCLGEGRPPSADELDGPRSAAARRAEERLPLEVLLELYHLAARTGWSALVEAAASEGERAALPVLAGRLFDHHARVTAAVVAGYAEEERQLASGVGDARRDLVEALLSTGTAPPLLVDRAGVQLGDAHLVLAVRVRGQPDSGAGAQGTVAARRCLRRMSDALAREAGERALSVLEPVGGAVLVPEDGTPFDAAHLLAALAKAAGAELIAGSARAAQLDEVPRAWATARHVRRLVTKLARGQGVYTLDDVLFEHTLMTPRESARQLVAVLDPIRERPELIDTLEAWFGADFDRRRAAARLSVHPNTLDYRLRRVSELVGRDITTAAGLQLIGAALTVLRLSR